MKTDAEMENLSRFGWEFWYHKYRAECVWGQGMVPSTALWSFASGWVLCYVLQHPHANPWFAWGVWIFVSLPIGSLLWENSNRDFDKEELTLPQDRNKEPPRNYMGD